jgi:hypothetical protein
MGSQVTLSQTSGHGPALTAFNNALVLAWAGYHNDYLNVASSTDAGQTWGSPTVITSEETVVGEPYPKEQTVTTPAIATLNGLFYVAWAGTDGHHSLNLMQSSDLKSFSDQVILPTFGLREGTGPALAVFENALFVAWTDKNNQLNLASIYQGTFYNWDQVGSETSYSSPALAADASYLYLAWTGAQGAVAGVTTPGKPANLNVIRSSNGKNFSNKQTLSETTQNQRQPALTVSGSSLILGWTGDDKNNSLNTIYSTDQGLTFGGKQTDTGNSSTAGPALYSSYIAWTGTDNRLNIKQGV